MKIAIKSLDNKDVGELELAPEVFGVKVRADILHRMVNYQLAKRRAGTHKVKHRGEISGTGKKPYSQKKTGRARQGSLRSTQFRGGAKPFGPVVRSHAHDLPKKVRALAMRTALSSKLAAGKLLILDNLEAKSHKTKDLAGKFAKFGLTNALIVGGETLDVNFCRAANNIPCIDVLPTQGANVYDILRRDVLVLTQDAVKALEARLK